jgi:flagella basal body P-ring formation protein FlgA
MTSRPFSLPLLTALLVVLSASAFARQDPAPVKQAVESFLRSQMRGLPGEASFTIGEIDADNRLSPCSALEASLAPGAKAWGRTSVAVRCRSARSWTIFVPVHISVIADYLVTATPLAQGQTISSSDVVRRRGDLADLPAGILTDESEAVGRTAALSISAGQPMRADMLRQPIVILQNQTVSVITRGQGFQVANEGKALSNGLDGQIIQVRLANGRVVSGIARAGGIVEMGF